MPAGRSVALFLFITVSASGPALGLSVDESHSKAVAEVMSEWDRQGSPGCALAVVEDQEIVFKRGYGLANLDYDLPITSRTVFDIGSTSKQFTAAAIALLAHRGKLQLDDDVRSYLPEMPNYGETVTIQHLVHHTSGVRDYLTLMLLAGLDSHDTYSLDNIVQLIAGQANLNFTPGSEFLYSNSGYMLLAAIVERLGEQSFGEFVEENFFGPLEMHDTFVYEDRGRIVPRRATLGCTQLTGDTLRMGT